MHSGVKLIVGIMIFLVGMYWYVPGNALGNTFDDLKIVVKGLFGLFLIFLGLVVAWIEYEDLKWEAKEKKEQPLKKEQTVKKELPAKKK